MTNKSTILKGSILSLAAIAGNAYSQTKPNIIYIMCDDLGIGEVGCYGQQKIKTPALDNMASEGMKFTQHYAGTSVCAPARCVLMTGHHNGHTYIRSNWEVSGYQEPIPDTTYTVAEMLKEEGYTTGCIGKWGLGGPNTEGHPNVQGFDHFFGYLGQVQAHNYYPDHLWRNTEQVLYPNNNTQEHTYSHDLMTDEAMWFIGENKDNPFFLYLPYTIPHTQHEIPSLGIYADSTGWETNQKIQAAMISLLDKDVGRILDTLQTLGIDSNTLVIFTSDNGPHGQNNTLNFFDGNGPYRGIKRELYEGGLRVPHIAWWPGKIQAGSETGHVSAFWDFFPTCSELAGKEPLANIDGKSFLPALLQQEQEKHDYMYFEIHESQTGGPKQSVLINEWKGVRKGMSSDMDAPIELYNLNDDIGETQNIAEQHPEIIQKMDYIMLTARTPHSHFNFGHNVSIQLTGLKVSIPYSQAVIQPGDTMQLSVDVIPSNAFNREFTLKAEGVTDGVTAEITKFGELVVNEVIGYVNVIVISKENSEISDTLTIEITNSLYVETKEPVYLSASSVMAKGAIVIPGKDTIDERGFVYSTSENPTVDDNKVISEDTTLFSATILGLTGGTPYYLRSYAKNSDKISYGNQVVIETTPVSLEKVLYYLTFYYPFEDNFDDGSLYGNELMTVNGDPVFSSEGVHGKCLVFDGNDDYLRTERNVLNPGKEEFTFCTWINPVNTDTRRLVFQQESVSGTGRSFMSLSGNVLASYLGGRDSYSTGTFKLNEWTHVAIAGDPNKNTVQFFINGKAEDILTGRNLESSSGEINIGRHKIGQFEDRVFYGKMDEPMLFKKTLNQFEILEIMNLSVIDTINDLDIKSPENDIVKFTIDGVDGKINSSTHTISVTVPYGTDLTNLIPTIELSDKASVSPESGVPQDFSNDVTYIVTAEDSTEQEWVVSVSVADNIYENALSNIMIYPNPMKHSFSIDLGDYIMNDNIYFKILDLSGRIILKEDCNDSGRIDVTIGMPKGCYLLNIFDGEVGIINQKIFVK